MAISLSRKLRSGLMGYYCKELKRADQKIAYYDKLKKWQMTGYCEDRSFIDHKKVILTAWWSPTRILIYLKNNYPFIKGVHLIIDDLVSYLGINPEELKEYQTHASVDFRFKDLLDIEIYGIGSCRAIYKEQTRIERKLVGYECGEMKGER